MATYSYEPLSAPKGEIRLMRLLPSTTESDEIKCDIFRVSLSEEWKYSALSYCWGTDHKSHHISVRGERLPVTASLHAALVNLRRGELDRILWVDAICINQEDVPEKTQQVGQMRDIYRQAEGVICWLGPSSDKSAMAVSWIQDFGERIKRLRLDPLDDAAIRDHLRRLDSMIVDWERRLGVSSRKDVSSIRAVAEHLRKEEASKSDIMLMFCDLYQSLPEVSKERLNLRQALDNFFWRRYWQRAWIVQEIYNAREVQFICGEMVVEESNLSSSLTFLQIFQEHQFRNGRGHFFQNFPPYQANAILRVRRLGISGTPLPLMYLLRHFRQSQAKLRIDKIYSLLGIATDVEDLNVVPDYATKAQESLTKIAKFLLKNGYTEVLSFCNGLTRTSELPSWVPDWSNLTFQELLLHRVMPMNSTVTELQPKFNAAADLPFTFQSSPSTEQNTLTLEGIRIGRIRGLGGSFETSRSRHWLDGILSFASVEAGDAQQRLYSACMTAVADQRFCDEDQILRADPELLRQVCNCVSSSWQENLTDHLRSEGFADYGQQLRRVARSRRPMKIDDLFFGIAPEHAATEDEVYVIAGATVPYIFRKVLETGNFNLVGEAYVHGIMDGQIVAQKRADLQTITVV